MIEVTDCRHRDRLRSKYAVEGDSQVLVDQHENWIGADAGHSSAQIGSVSSALANRPQLATTKNDTKFPCLHG